MEGRKVSRREFLALGGTAALALVGLGLVGCGAQSQGAAATTSAATTGSSAQPVTLKVAYMPNLGSASSLFTGIDQGFFKEQGITIEPQQFQKGPAEITAMQSGDIDISQIGHGAHSLAIKGQATVIALDQLSKADAVVANKSKGVSTAADLKGKTVAVSSGTSSQIILTYVLQKAGLTTSDITTVEMDVAGMTTALVAGQVDAAATWSPNTITLKQQLGDNYLELGTNADFTDKVAFPASFVVTPDYDKANQDVLARFGAALLKAQAYRAEHIEDVAKKVAADINVDEDTLVKSVNEGDWKAPVDDAGDEDKIRSVYEAQQQAFIDSKAIDAKVPVESYVDFALIKKYAEAYKASK